MLLLKSSILDFELQVQPPMLPSQSLAEQSSLFITRAAGSLHILTCRPLSQPDGHLQILSSVRPTQQNRAQSNTLINESMDLQIDSRAHLPVLSRTRLALPHQAQQALLVLVPGPAAAARMAALLRGRARYGHSLRVTPIICTGGVLLRA